LSGCYTWENPVDSLQNAGIDISQEKLNREAAKNAKVCRGREETLRGQNNPSRPSFLRGEKTAGRLPEIQFRRKL